LYEFGCNLFVCGIPHFLNDFKGSLGQSPQSFLAWSGFFDRWLQLRLPTGGMQLTLLTFLLAFLLVSDGGDVVLVIVLIVTIDEFFINRLII
jgi:hypothetical protein